MPLFPHKNTYKNLPIIPEQALPSHTYYHWLVWNANVALTFQVRIAKLSLILTSGKTRSCRSRNCNRHWWSAWSPVIIFPFSWLPVYARCIFYPQFTKAVGFSRQICHMLEDAFRVDYNFYRFHSQHVGFVKICSLHQICRITKQKKVLESLLVCFVGCILALVTSEASFDLIYAVLYRSCRRQREAVFGRILRRWRWWKDL